jgi:hypothetical protein
MRAALLHLRHHKGQMVVDFKAIPVLQVDKLTEALLDQFYAVHEAPEVEEVRQVL